MMSTTDSTIHMDSWILVYAILLCILKLHETAVE